MDMAETRKTNIQGEIMFLEYEKPQKLNSEPYKYIMWGKPDSKNNDKWLWVAPTLEELWEIYG